MYFDPSGKNTYLYSCWVCFGFLVCCLIYFPFSFFGYGMSIESLVIVERQPDNQPKATVSNTDCLSHVFPVLLKTMMVTVSLQRHKRTVEKCLSVCLCEFFTVSSC